MAGLFMRRVRPSLRGHREPSDSEWSELVPFFVGRPRLFGSMEPLRDVVEMSSVSSTLKGRPWDDQESSSGFMNPIGEREEHDKPDFSGRPNWGR